MSKPLNLKDFATESLRERFAEAGIKPFRAAQVAQWLYVRGVEDPLEMTDLDKPLREKLSQEWKTQALGLADLQRSVDGTIKGVLRAEDGALIEAVIIPEGDRRTLCISSQVGCALACSFCATGEMGFTRNLSGNGRASAQLAQCRRSRSHLPGPEDLRHRE
ncbi:MAG: hypothetical protein JRC77_11775 [Deltaproteobacteria bacterium]|nr:hypothetical protein [Deltaproteobacteria bacterium]